MSDVRTRKDRFREAMLDALHRMEADGITITKAAVIDSARFQDGKSVGKATLYAKHEKTGLLNHAELHKEIDEAISRQCKRKGRRNRRESIAELQLKLKTLKAENGRLVDTVVSQQSQIRDIQVKSNVAQANRNIERLESDSYILAKIIDSLTSGSLEKATLISRRFEIQWREDDRFTEANKEFHECMNVLRDSKLAPIFRGS